MAIGQPPVVIKLNRVTDDKHGLSEASETGSAIGGALAGTAIALITDPFIGGASGAVVARALRRVGAEIEHRILGPRQQSRIGEAIEIIAVETQTRVEKGREPRGDGFFAATDDAPADELLEGVLRTAADAWEQRKVPHIAHFFAEVAFDASTSAAEASFLLRVGDNLTYRQLLLLAFWHGAQRPRWTFEGRLRDVISAGISADASVIAEMDELAGLRLLGIVRSEGEVRHPGETIAGMENFGTFGGGVDLRTVTLTARGERLHRLLGLASIPAEELAAITSALFVEG